MKKRKLFLIVMATIVLLILLIIVLLGILAYCIEKGMTEKSDYAIQRDKEIQKRIINDPELYSKLKQWREGKIELSDEEIEHIYNDIFHENLSDVNNLSNKVRGP
ncbi:MAG: hypothetical protein ABFR90_06730 [Planctomycetota bacterium]